MRNVSVLAVAILFFVSDVSLAKELAGEIVSVSGMVFIRQDKQSGSAPKSPPRAKPGENVYSGDVINTSSEGSVKILMRDKSIIDLGPSSLFKVDEYQHQHGGDRKAKLNLAFGKLRVAVTKKIENGGKFQVKTNGATMGVRGTEFIIKEDIPDRLGKKDSSSSPEAPKQKTEITVVQGKVDVNASVSNPAPKTTVSLTAGSQLTTGAGVPSTAPMAPVKISEAQMKTLTFETRIVDNTFAKAVTIEPMNNNDQGQGRPQESNEGRGNGDKGKSFAGGNSNNESRSPASDGRSGASPSVIAPMINIALPPVVMGPPPVIDVPGVPTNPFQNNGFRNNMKRLHVTIVIPSTGAMP
jgi:hypothetical protein